MGRFGLFLAGLLTVLVLDALAFGLFASLSGAPLTSAAFAAGPEERAARAAFAKAVKGFPGEIQPADRGGLTLLSQPGAVGEYLCQARALAFSPPGDGTSAKPGLTTSDILVLRRLPGDPPQTEAQASQVCGKWRDFAHPIAGDAVAVSRVLADLGSAQAKARSGALVVAPNCLDYRSGGRARPCNTAAVLAALDLHGLYKVQSLVDDLPLGAAPGVTEDAYLRGGKGACGAPDRIAVRLVTRGFQGPMTLAAISVRVMGGC